MDLSPYSLLLFLVFFIQGRCDAQEQLYVPGQVLVSLYPGKSPEVLGRRLKETFISPAIFEKKVSNLLNVWLLEVTPGEEQNTLEWLHFQPEVRVAQINQILENRGSVDIFPDDPLFSQQWQFVNTGANGGAPNADLDAELAWDITTGGLTPAGDTIVVAVIDNGVDKNHKDLKANLWVNREEIPDDYLDNDANGYTDDFFGWNVTTDNDNIMGFSTGHGTPVSAIIGARGDNGEGVAGVNWHVKIMFVAGGGTVDKILEAYDYVLQARRRYNTSNGAGGAFVVAVNCSWGTNYGQPADAPLWCAAFDSLGAAGILSVASTANIPVNVDEVGDLPTACPSDYLVSVTSLNKADQKAFNAAWGAMHIDLGAYGQEVFTAGANDNYGPYSGTSFAAPHVSGAVGLLYSSSCPNLIAMAKTDPAGAALFAKNLMLDSAQPTNSLQGITLSGGRLNLFSFLQDYEDQCSPCPPPFGLYAVDIKLDSVLLKWSEIADFQTVKLRWRPLDAATWNIVEEVDDQYLLAGLDPCTVYEFSLSARCGPDESSDWSPPATFKTDGCCEPPAWIWWDWVNTTSASLTWKKVTAANGYQLRVRQTGGAWENYDVNATAFTLQNLLPCTDYEAQVQTLCDTGATAFSNICFFKTAGCGSCTDADYCTAKAEHAKEEWIASVTIGTWQYESGSGGGGYQNFTGNQQSLLELNPLNPENVVIIPGFQGAPYKEFFRIYVDFNMDGDFDDDGELAFDPGWATDGPVYGQLVVPDFSVPGMTRMRVMMKYKGGNNPPPMPCETFGFGQVEDYCVALALPVSTGLPTDANAGLLIYPQPAGDEVWFKLPGGKGVGECRITVWDAAGRRVLSGLVWPQEDIVRLVTINWPSGVYVAEVVWEGRVFKKMILKA